VRRRRVPSITAILRWVALGVRVMKVFRPLFGMAAALPLVLLGTGAASASVASSSTCAGGSIAAGTYRSLTITGRCAVDSGNVVVERDVTVAPGGGLNAAFSGSNLRIGRNLSIGAGGLLVFGCSPLGGDFPCFNNRSGSTHHSVGGNLVATNAVLMIVHHDKIAGNVTEIGGGGGLTCKALFPGGPPPYTDYDDDIIGGSVRVADLRTCWDGFLGTTVGGSVRWSYNHTVIGDGNLMGTNTIHGDLNCFHNSPMPHLSDDVAVPNTVSGTASGQCSALAAGPATSAATR
jgi:hypothetical protein